MNKKAPRLAATIPGLVIHLYTMANIVKTGTTCKICGKPLSDPLSIERGIGPDCYQTYKMKEYMNKTENLFANRSEFSWGVDGNVLWIEDLHGAKSVTNDMDSVLVDIAHELREQISSLLIMYKDSRGIWDGVVATFNIAENLGNFRHTGKGADVQNVSFFSLNEKEYKPARQKLLFLRQAPSL